MKNTLIFTLAIASTVTILDAGAQTYQWKDSAGRTVISDTPPPGSAKESSRTIGGKSPNTTTSAANKPAEAAKSFAEKDMDFKKRQQESAEKANKEAKEKSAAAEKRENCDRAQRQVTLMESGQRVAMSDENGERRVMDDAERQKELDRARRSVSDFCK